MKTLRYETTFLLRANACKRMPFVVSASKARISNHIVYILFILILFCLNSATSMHRQPATVIIKKPIIHTPEVKSYRVFSLKEICFAYGIKMYGQDFMNRFVEHSTTKKDAPKDLKEDAIKYYCTCFHEIDACLGKRYPTSHYFLHEPPAQPINKIIMLAHAKKRFDLVKIVMEYYYANHKWPAITLLAGAGYFDSVKILLECGDQVNHRDFLLRTPLMCAARNNQLEVIHELLKHNPDTTLIDACNLNALQHAREKMHGLIANHLIEHEKKQIAQRKTTRNNDVR